MKNIIVFPIAILSIIEVLYNIKVYGGYGITDYDIETVKLWTVGYPCRSRRKDMKINTVVMLPHIRKFEPTRKLLKGNQKSVFGDLFTNFRLVYLRYFLYQADTSSVKCKEWPWNPEAGFYGKEGWYEFNMNWMLDRFVWCARRYLKFTPPPRDYWNNVVIFVAEEEPFYDRWKRGVLPTDWVPWQVYGYEMLGFFNEGGYEPLFIVKEGQADTWLDFIHRLQVPSRSIMEMENYTQKRLIEAIDEMICVPTNKKNNNFFLYYVDHKFGLASTSHDFIKYPIFFIWVFPRTQRRDYFRFMETHEHYDTWQTMLSVFGHRYPNSESGHILYTTGSLEDRDKTCEDYNYHGEISVIGANHHALFRWRKADPEYDGSRPYKAVVNCLETLLRFRHSATRRVDGRMVFFISFGDTSPMNLPQTEVKRCKPYIEQCKAYNFAGDFLYYINIHRGHIHTVTDHFLESPDLNKIDYLEYLFEQGHSHTRIPFMGYHDFPRVVNTVIKALDKKLVEFNSPSLEQMENEIAKMNKNPYSRLDLIVSLPNPVTPDILPGAAQFLRNFTTTFKNTLKNQFEPEFIRAGVITHSGFRTPNRKTPDCNILTDISISISRPRESFRKLLYHYTKTKKMDFSFINAISCIKSQLNKKSTKNTLKVVAVITDLGPSNVDAGNKFHQKEEPIESTYWRLYRDALRENIHIVFFTPLHKFRRIKYKHIIPTSMYPFDTTQGFQAAIAKSVVDILEQHAS